MWGPITGAPPRARVTIAPVSSRVCPACGRLDALSPDRLVFPPDWACPSCGHRLPVDHGILLTAPALLESGESSQSPDFDFLAEAERDHFWFVARRKLIVGLAERYAPGARRILEVGCGTGNVLDALYASRPWTRAVGIDLYPRGLELARRNMPAAVELFQADARAIPVRDAFDLAGAFDVLEHIVEDDAVIGGIRAALVENGVFLAAVPQHPSLWSAADDVAGHVRRYERGELERKVRAAGFEILFSTSYAVALLPVMALSRVSARSAKGHDTQAAVRREFDVPPGVNRALTAVLVAETHLSRWGVRWPIGGSRVIVAKRR